MDTGTLYKILPELPDKAKELLRIEDNKLRNRLIAEWAIDDTFDEIEYKPFPEIPEEIKAYFKLPSGKKEDAYQALLKNPKNDIFFKKTWQFAEENRNNYLWLRDLWEWLSPEDIERRQKVRHRIQSFLYGLDTETYIPQPQIMDYRKFKNEPPPQKT